MIDFTLKFENEQIKNLFVMFLKNYTGPVCEFINAAAPHEGITADASMEFNDDAITLYQYAPDKGAVMGTFTPDVLTVGQYKDLAVGGLYTIIGREGLHLMLKTDASTPDKLVGRYKTINDAFSDIGKPHVKERVAQLTAGPLDGESVKERVKGKGKKAKA